MAHGGSRGGVGLSQRSFVAPRPRSDHRSCDRMGREAAGRDPRLQGASARLAAAELLLKAVLVPQVWHPTEHRPPPVPILWLRAVAGALQRVVARERAVHEPVGSVQFWHLAREVRDARVAQRAAARGRGWLDERPAYAGCRRQEVCAEARRRAWRRARRSRGRRRRRQAAWCAFRLACAARCPRN